MPHSNDIKKLNEAVAHIGFAIDLVKNVDVRPNWQGQSVEDAIGSLNKAEGHIKDLLAGFQEAMDRRDFDERYMDEPFVEDEETKARREWDQRYEDD